MGWKLNNIQAAIAAYIIEAAIAPGQEDSTKKQMVEVPAGMGKSRISAGVAIGLLDKYKLKDKEDKVIVVWPNEILKR